MDAVVIRDFRIREGHTLQFRTEASNIMNTPIFDFPNTTPTSNQFGMVLPSQLNRPREVEFAFRYSF
jgi:hypothetical protein